MLLVNPPRYKGIPVIREDRCENADRDCVHPPTSLIYLAGALREEEFDVGLLDMNGLDLDWSYLNSYLIGQKFDWIIFRSIPSTFFYDIKVVEIAKKFGIKTMMLNWNLHHVPEKVLKECPDFDVYVSSYHYEYLIPKLLLQFDEPLGQGKFVSDESYKTLDIPSPPWGMVDDFNRFYTRTKWFSPWAVVRGSKGCNYRCAFCIDQNQPWCSRSPELIGEELEYLVKKRGVERISFFDNTFEVGKNWCLEIADEIEKRKLEFKWYINSRADLICKHGIDFFKRLHEVGLDGSSIGIEFTSQEMLDMSRKDTTVEDNYGSIDILHKAGVKSYASCMMGYLHETEEQIMKTVEFLKKARPTGFQLNPVTVYEGTTLWRQAVEAEKLPEEIDWRGMSCVPTDILSIQLGELTPEELDKLRRRVYKEIYTGKWLVTNALRVLKTPSDWKIGLGYFLSSFDRLRKGVVFSH